MKLKIVIIVASILCALSCHRQARELPPVRFEEIKFQENYYDIVYVNLPRARIELFWQDEHGNRFGSFKELDKWLKGQNRELIAATNAGIFAPDYAPVGLLIERGKVLHELNLQNGEGNFFLKPNGIFLIDEGGAKVIEASQFSSLKSNVSFATQSGPLLVLNGKLHPAFMENSTNRVVRSGIGIVSPTEVYIAISKAPVNFFDFATLFQTRLHCPNALYLDGHISKLYEPGEKRFDDGNFSAILAVMRD